MMPATITSPTLAHAATISIPVAGTDKVFDVPFGTTYGQAEHAIRKTLNVAYGGLRNRANEITLDLDRALDPAESYLFVHLGGPSCWLCLGFGESN